MQFLKNRGTPVESHMAPVDIDVYDDILLEFSKDKTGKKPFTNINLVKI